MRGCGLSRYETGTSAVDLGWYHELSGGGQIAHRLVYKPETEAAPHYPADLFLRLLCHYLVDSVPEKAIPELVDSVLTIFDHYAVPRRSLVFSSESQHVPAVMGRVFESPSFHAEAD